MTCSCSHYRQSPANKGQIASTDMRVNTGRWLLQTRSVVTGDGNYMASNCSDSDFFKNSFNTFEKVVVVFKFIAISASKAITWQQGVKLTLTKHQMWVKISVGEYLKRLLTSWQVTCFININFCRKFCSTQTPLLQVTEFKSLITCIWKCTKQLPDFVIRIVLNLLSTKEKHFKKEVSLRFSVKIKTMV